MNHSTRDGKYEEGIYESMRFGFTYTPRSSAVPKYLAGLRELLKNAEKEYHSTRKKGIHSSQLYIMACVE